MVSRNSKDTLTNSCLSQGDPVNGQISGRRLEFETFFKRFVGLSQPVRMCCPSRNYYTMKQHHSIVS